MIRVLNQTKNTVVSECVQKLITFSETTRGLSGAVEPHAVTFKTRWGIHTFGVRFPIDVIVCDTNTVVRRVHTNMHPSQVYFWNPRYSIVFEFPTGVVARSCTEIGDVLVCSDGTYL